MITNEKTIKPFLIIRITIFFLIIVSATPMLLPLEVYSARSNGDVEMEVKAGFDGAARLGSYIPYRVLLINKGRTVNGEVQIEVKIDSENKSIISKPVSLPEGSVKEIVINAPVFTARRGVKIRFTEGNKTIKEIEYTFTKLIPPDMKTIGILSSDNSAYNFLNGAMILQPIDHRYIEKMRITSAAGVYSTTTNIIVEDGVIGGEVSKVESVLLPLDDESLPEDIKVMKSFDILIISNYDTGILSGQQLETLEKWVEEGGTLVLGSGVNWKKIYNTLPQSLKKFSVTDTVSTNKIEDLENFSGINFVNDVSLSTVTGSIGFKTQQNNEQSKMQQPEKDQVLFSPNINEVIIGSDEQPLAVKYIHGNGRILFLTFDPGMEPVASWNGRQAFWEKLLFHSSISSNNIYEHGTGYYYSNYNNMYYNYLAEQVPEDRTPPFPFMFITIVVYIIIVGPFLYLFLKKKDKREISWIAIPAVALLCTFIIYLAGFKTRYRTAVLNTVSMINLDMENQRAEIVTGMGVFNNKRGDLKLTYPEKDGIEFDITQIENRSYVMYADGKEPEGKVVSKIVLSDPISYELYNVSMWEPKYISASKTEAFEDKIISSLNISDGKIKAIIENTTKYDFMDAFITLGSNFISIGDILSGQKKVVDVDLNSENVYKSFGQYLDAQYGRASYPSNVAPPKDFPEKRRKRIAVDSLLGAQYSEIKGQTKIGFYALNYQNLGYDIKINSQEPIEYYTNGIFSSLEMNFEKGQRFDIPAGIILPEVSQESFDQDIASVDGDSGVRVRGTGDIDFIYNIPEGLYPDVITLKFDTYIPLYIKYNIENMKERNNNLQTKILQNKYEYYLYNTTLNRWEEIEDNHIQTENVSQYVDENNRLKVRVKVVEMADMASGKNYDYVETEQLAFPKLQLKGVVK